MPILASQGEQREREERERERERGGAGGGACEIKSYERSAGRKDGGADMESA